MFFDVYNVSCAVDSRAAEKKLDWKVLTTLKVVPCCCCWYAFVLFFDVYNVSCAVDSRVAEKKLDWKVPDHFEGGAVLLLLVGLRFVFLMCITSVAPWIQE